MRPGQPAATHAAAHALVNALMGCGAFGPLLWYRLLRTHYLKRCETRRARLDDYSVAGRYPSESSERLALRLAVGRMPTTVDIAIGIRWESLEAPPGFEPGMEVLQTGPGRLSC